MSSTRSYYTNNMAAKYPPEAALGGSLSSSMSSDSVSEDPVNCLICTEPFQNPRTLPCQHVFCLACLNKYFTSVQNEGNIEKGTLPCPICRQIVTISDSDIGGLTLDDNGFDLETLVGKLSVGAATNGVKPRRKVSCDVCKYKRQEIPAQDHCASCGINYCGHCSHDHSKHCLFRNHAVIPVAHMEKSSMRCEQHKEENVKYYCMTCLSPLCTVCAVTDHQSHDTKELNDALVGKKDAIQDRIAGLSEKVMTLEEFLVQMEDFQTLKEAALKKTKMKIERHANHLMGQIQMRKHAILEELEKQHEASIKSINLEKEDVAFQLANIKSLWKFAAKLMEPSQTLQLLAMHGDIDGMIHTTVNKPKPSLPQDCTLMTMFMPRQDITVGAFQKCEMTADLMARIPTRRFSNGGLSNGTSHQDSVKDSSYASSTPRSASMSLIQSVFSPQRSNTAPPKYFEDNVSMVKYQMSPKLLWKVDKVGSKAGEICESYDVTILPDGCTIVAEWMNQRLQLFDESGKSISMINVGQVQPWGLTVTREGNLAVTDDRDRSVKILSPTGEMLVSWRRQMFGWPRGICENTLGQYIVSDTEHGKHTVSIHLPDGRCVRKFGSQGSGNTQFHWPRYVTVDRDDRIIVSDGSNNCMKVFDPSGQFMFKFGSLGREDGQLKHPRGVCVDPQNNIIIADQDNNRVSMFTADGKFVRHLLALTKPWGVAVSEDGKLAVTQKPSVSVYKVFDLIV